MYVHVCAVCIVWCVHVCLHVCLCITAYSHTHTLSVCHTWRLTPTHGLKIVQYQLLVRNPVSLLSLLEFGNQIVSWTPIPSPQRHASFSFFTPFSPLFSSLIVLVCHVSVCCVYVCTCTCMCVYVPYVVVYVWMCVQACTYTLYVSVSVCVVCACVCVYVYMYVCMCTCPCCRCMCICMYVCTLYVYVCMYVCMYVHVCM